jgi:hypothetical protein
VEVVLRDVSSLARACGQAAQKLVDAFALDPEIRFSAHVTRGDDVAEIGNILRDASATVMQNLDDVLDLFRTQSKLRALAYKANAERVSDLIAEKESYLMAAERVFGGMHVERSRGSQFGKHDAEDVAARLSGITQRLKLVTNDMVTDTLRVSKLSDADLATITDRLAEVHRRQREVSRELARANLGKSVALPEDVVAILRKHKIV